MTLNQIYLTFKTLQDVIMWNSLPSDRDGEWVALGPSRIIGKIIGRQHPTYGSALLRQHQINPQEQIIYIVELKDGHKINSYKEELLPLTDLEKVKIL